MDRKTFYNYKIDQHKIDAWMATLSEDDRANLPSNPIEGLAEKIGTNDGLDQLEEALSKYPYLNADDVEYLEVIAHDNEFCESWAGHIVAMELLIEEDLQKNYLNRQ